MQPLSLAVIGARRVQKECQAILASAGAPPATWRSAPLGGATRLLRRYQPAAILLDAVTAPLEALFVLPTLQRLSPGARIVLVGSKPEWTEFILEGLRRGACGHVTVADLPRYLQRALQAVATGQPWVPRRMTASIVAEMRAPAGAPTHPRLRVIQGGAPRSPSSRRRARRRRAAASPLKACR